MLRRDGVEITEGAEVFELVKQGRRLTQVRTAAGDLEAGTVVLAAGAWTTPLAASIGISLPMEPGKGYSFSIQPEVVPSHAVLLVDVHVGCTPFGDRLRIGGTMEFSGINNRLDRRRIASIVAGARQSFLPWKTPEIESEWAGMRPITADGLPVLDRAGDLENTYIATGYSMQGVTLAPTSGRALAEMITTGRRPLAARALPARPLPADAASPADAPGSQPAAGMSSDRRRLRVAIIGSGNIGTDLMIKVERSPLLELVGMAGIDPESDGLRRARERGHVATDAGLAALLDLVDGIDLAFDATSAHVHPEHARLLAERGITQRRPDARGARPGGRAAGQPGRALRRPRGQR